MMALVGCPLTARCSCWWKCTEGQLVGWSNGVGTVPDTVQWAQHVGLRCQPELGLACGLAVSIIWLDLCVYAGRVRPSVC